ncbi:MAG TPA: hypothetical protein VNJ01_09670 [Bacteriovoracaceae bacterium]|nr:hypothetical protein [Bacteriovoracaceae bacterium]
MLNSRRLNLFSKLHLLLLTLACATFVSCIEQGKRQELVSGNSTSDTTKPTYAEPVYPLEGTFLQEGAVRTSTILTVPLDFSDSFMVRGKDLSLYLRKLPNTTKFCLVGKYNHIPGSDKFLLMTAKPKSFTDLLAKTTEFYLQVEPSNSVSNKNDCLSYNLSNVLYANATLPSLNFSQSEVCPNCSTTLESKGLKLYFYNGEEVPTINVSPLILSFSGTTTSTGTACTESTSCVAKGFDCCLATQCVKDGKPRPGINSSMPGYASAIEDVLLNPNRFVLYPQFYFVCESRPEETTGGSTGGGTSTDPDYLAAIRLLELTHLYNCLNQVDGEFSHCTVKFTQASALMGDVFYAKKDDVNFSTLNTNLTTGDYVNNIVKITYGGRTLYELNRDPNVASTTPLTVGSFEADTHNDSLTTAQGVRLSTTAGASAIDDNLYLTYKVDGTCQKVGNTLAKCTKTYIQGSTAPYETTRHNSTKIFKLPAYADLSSTANIIIKVSGVVVAEEPTTWVKNNSTKEISFTVYPLLPNQKIEITYFTSQVAALFVSRDAAQSSVNAMCECVSLKCNLKPVKDEQGAVINYDCLYPVASSTEPPINQTVVVSSRSVPHRYYDEGGVNYDEADYLTAPTQELKAFAYTGNNLLKPNNVSDYIGFNEINGSFAKSGTYTALPAKLVKVKKDKLYDILVNSGAFSSCTSCGSDYYSALQKIFPQNFTGNGGGYQPDMLESRRENNTGLYRADDLHFGRACFVPASMIPWTHYAGTSLDPNTQRRSRLASQHFLFANGYNKDWFGFDYGSLIGSFDGVSWFSVGNQRRIKASGGKLYLAINSYFGDLNVNNSFSVTVSESSAFSSPIADHDTETDGAQCQKAHFCAKDDDCFKQLGFDYSCQNVSGIMTNWPNFDPAGAEVPGTTVRTIASLVGGTNGQSKRCVYRGRGAPCLSDLSQASTADSFNKSFLVGTLGCSANTSCVSTTSSKFNDRIARFAVPPAAQNLAVAAPTPSDFVGFGARILGRPYDYYGTKPLPPAASPALGYNKVLAICAPGKEVNASMDTYDLNALNPTNRVNSADKLFGVGATPGTAQSPNYLNACPATDAAGVSLHNFDLPLSDLTLNSFTISQNLPSNLLDLTPLKSLGIFSSQLGSQVLTVGYQQNTCLRAPGASCFTDMECAPSANIASKARPANLLSVLNEAEEKFWEEDLVCGNVENKYLSAGVVNPNFDIKKNNCCREIGKVLTVYTETSTSTHKWCEQTTKKVRVAGVNIPVSTASRYSRVHTAYDKITCDVADTSKSFALSVTGGTAPERMAQILGQYRTLDTINERTCCTKNWIRSFATENGGGHKFNPTKMQNIDKSMFKNVSWLENRPMTGVTDGPFECEQNNYANTSCEVRSITPSDELKYLTWAGSLELIGIPQVAVKTNDEVYQLVDELQALPLLPTPPLIKSIEDVNAVGADFQDGLTGPRYYSAASYSKFKMGANEIKKVFSESEFNCCIPSNQEVTDTTTAAQCCTGNLSTGEGVKRCCMPNFTDLTVYLNRYVSSEGRGLPETAYDKKTGYIKDAGQVKLIAAQKNLCCSGSVMTGVAISQMSIPLLGGTYLPGDLATSRRFNYRIDEVDNNGETGSVGSIFDKGVRWNNHVYCVPEGFGQ